MKTLLYSILIVVISASFAVSAPFAKWTKTELVLDNGVVQRIIKLPAAEGQFLTTSYKPLSGEFKYFQPSNTDFQFEVNGISYSGNSNWSLVEVKTIGDEL